MRPDLEDPFSKVLRGKDGKVSDGGSGGSSGSGSGGKVREQALRRQDLRSTYAACE